MSHYFKRLAARSRINQVGGMQGEAPVRVATTTIGGIDRAVNPGVGGNLEIHQEAVTVSGPAIPMASVKTGSPAVSEHPETMPGVTGKIPGGAVTVKLGSSEVTGSGAEEVTVAKTALTDRKLAASPVDETATVLAEARLTSPGQLSNPNSNLSAASGESVLSATTVKGTEPQEVAAVSVATGLRGEQNPGRSRAEASSLAVDVRPSANETANGAQVRPIDIEPDTDPTQIAAVVIRDNPWAGTAAGGSKGDANHAIAATVRGPRVQPRNPSPASNGIEIKIGKIDLEIHQADTSKKPVPSQPRTRQMASESIAPGNNLSRYYLRGGYG